MPHRDGNPGQAARPAPRAALLLAIGVVCAASGCARVHLTRDHGEASRKAFAVQVVPAPDAGHDLLRVLDGSSGQQIYDNYRESLSITDTSKELGERPQFHSDQ